MACLGVKNARALFSCPRVCDVFQYQVECFYLVLHLDLNALSHQWKAAQHCSLTKTTAQQVEMHWEAGCDELDLFLLILIKGETPQLDVKLGGSVY